MYFLQKQKYDSLYDMFLIILIKSYLTNVKKSLYKYRKTNINNVNKT